MLSVGDKLPPFELEDQRAEPRTLADLAGEQGLILFVYSKDNTSGCTAEAAEFQERLEQFKALGYGIAGISKDAPKSHARFAAKLELGYPLLADPEHVLLEGLGAWAEKKSGGKVTMAAVRSTFVADTAGELIWVWPKVKAKGHAQEVLEELGPPAAG